MGALVVLSGLINVAASEPHSPLVHQFFRLRPRTLDCQPYHRHPDLTEPERIRRGSGNYEGATSGSSSMAFRLR
ncbi:hypothetical protein ACCUM_0706 [Candidatus Accumulibacter phosphatis]|uniref:Uncharacterized protein n=1 Tax=Candidatus Accumulibacter phosphatis TaxID=327160 RepID=A0A5S4ETL4_9PROT|nr:hypothetical protein ACCUM_0706 [Candidatus Accumulibacter phosphatis]